MDRLTTEASFHWTRKWIRNEPAGFNYLFSFKIDQIGSTHGHKLTVSWALLVALEKTKSTKLNILKLNRKLDVSDKRKCHKKDALDDN